MSNYQNLLKEDVTIESVSTSTVDDYGLYNSSWASSSTTKGRLVSRGSIEDDEETELLKDDLDLYIPASVSVTSNNRINIDSNYYDIVGIETRKDRHGKAVLKVLQIRKST